MIAIVHLVVSINPLDRNEPRNAVKLVHAIRARTITLHRPLVNQVCPVELQVGIIDLGRRHLGCCLALCQHWEHGIDSRTISRLDISMRQERHVKALEPSRHAFLAPIICLHTIRFQRLTRRDIRYKRIKRITTLGRCRVLVVIHDLGRP